MKRKVSFLLIIFMTVCLIASNGAYAGNTNIDNDYEECVNAIDSFIDAKYSTLATLQNNATWNKSTVNCAENFACIEQQLITAQLELMNDYKEILRFKNYHLTKEYGNHSKSTNGNVYIDVSVKCEFNYEISPEVKSAFGMIYTFVLAENEEGHWVITGRTYPSNFERTFWGNREITVENAVNRKNEIIASKSAISLEGLMSDICINNDTDLLLSTNTYTSYAASNKANAAQIAVQYVEPISTTPGSNGYDYQYPSGYSQKSLDCTNYVSFCLNYGGDIPEDNTGSSKWKRNTYAWYNVDGFYDYFSSTKNSTSKGFFGTTYYTGTTYPSSSVRSNTEKSDIVQFSSVSSNDWTHSAIVTYVNPSNDVYVCMHDALAYYEQCSLLSFYLETYPDISYIRFMKITGYYE